MQGYQIQYVILYGLNLRESLQLSVEFSLTLSVYVYSILIFLLLVGVKVPPKDETTLNFSSSMSEEDFFKWLKSKGVSEKDCKTLSGKLSVTGQDSLVLVLCHCY